ncbi:ATP-dependent DNA/RNA helicase [Terramyces sp. JEL0728]|nr:ATP-dependent DNA/RNA helicase [Terramyces sp. JEL0728]
MSFESMDLDPRLLRAVAKLGYKSPTIVQETAIPLALDGKDILARAKTGSGKTAAYCIPIIQKILSKATLSTQALILVPTRELAQQVTQNIKELCMYCTAVVKVLNVSIGDTATKDQIPLLAEKPQIIVSTPAKISEHLQTESVDLSDLESLVVDEADLILSYGYDEDVEKILAHLPQIYQSYLMSATLSPDVEKLKKLVLKNPAILKLEESAEDDLLTQYYTTCSDEEKYLLTLFMLKLKVHPFGSSKSIIFVNSIEKCYKLRLFLEQFGIKSCTLNSELPVKSRFHIVQEFNRGIYDYIIATDESGDLKSLVLDSDDEGEQEVVEEDKKKRKKIKQDEDYGVSRGIDFKNVSAVINFDMPLSSRQYQHRVGRTARGVGNKGYALSFVVPEEDEKIVYKRKRAKISASKAIKVPSDEQILARILKKQEGNSNLMVALGRELLPFSFDMTPVERFRYRCQDALRAVSTTVVKEARLKEIKNEIINSEKLKTHFEDNPADLQALRHDKSIHPTRVQSHMRHVPDYMLPKGKVTVSSGNSSGYVPFKIEKKRRGKKFKKVEGASSKRKKDPLKSFSYTK